MEGEFSFFNPTLCYTLRIELYHGSSSTFEFPEIRKTKYTKDFSWGFYCTNNYEQARKWANRKSDVGVVNVYSYEENTDLSIIRFKEMTDEWLDFIGKCRAGFVHEQIDCQVRHYSDMKGMSHSEARALIRDLRKKWASEHEGKKISLGNLFVSLGVSIETSILSELCRSLQNRSIRYA